jgi:outer membrane protein TolC
MTHKSLFFLILSIGIFPSHLVAQAKNLDEYLNAAMANAPQVKEAYAKVEQSRIDSSVIGSAYKPQVNFNGEALTAPSYGQYGYDRAITNGGTYEALVSATQIIAPRKEININHTLSSYERQSLSVQAKQAEIDLKKSVTEKYINICLLQQQAAFYAKSDSFLVRESGTLKVLTDKGIYHMSDYYALLVEEQSERVQIAQLRVQMLQSFGDLNTTCGISDTGMYILSIPHLSVYNQKDVKQLLGYQKLQYDSLQYVSQQALLNAQYYPHLSWYADAGIEASQPDLIYRSIGNSLGLNLNIPIYDGHKKALKLKSIGISEGIRYNYQQYLIKSFSSQSASLIKQMENTDKLVAQLKQEELQVNEWIKVDEAQLNAGNISVTDFLIGLKKQLEVKNDIAQAIINQQLLQNEFNYRNQ